jgi:ATP-grasp domain, R2K clade family 3
VWHFLFPNGSTPDAPDEMFADQHAALTAAGFTASICPDSVLAGVKPLRGVPPGSTVVYRGWMATAVEYAALVRAIEQAGAVPLTSPREYLTAHHLSNWYPLLAELTPETRVLPTDAELVAELRAIDWAAYFIKDFVKSLKTGRGSVVRDPADAPAVVAELREDRGRIEGGICVRRVEEFLPESEQRYFVLRGVGYAESGGSVPNVVRVCAERVPTPFFSVDVVRRRDGVLRVVEVGDGQVSDLVGWSAGAFATLWGSAPDAEPFGS